MTEKRKLNPLIPIMAILLIALALLCYKFWTDKTDAEKLAAEYKTSYDNLVEETEKAKQEEAAKAKAAEEAAAKAAKLAEDYQNNYNQIVYSMLEDAALAEDLGNLIIKVWHNAIWQTSDEETDRYTKENGGFVSDFNDALGNLYNDSEFASQALLLSKNQQSIKDEMKLMLEPPQGFENAFKALEGMYNSYIQFTNIVLRCDGSYNSFSEDFASADEDLSQKYHGTELYVK